MPNDREDSVNAAWPSPHGAWFPRIWQVIVAAALFVAMFLNVLWDGPFRGLDQWLADAVQSWGIRELTPTGIEENEPWNTIGFLLSQTGGRWTNVTWILVLCVMAWVTDRTLVPLLRVGVAVFIMWAAVYPFKEWMDRSFPMDPAGDYFGAVGGLGGAYPSGHQTNSILLGSVGAWIAVQYIRQRWLRHLVCWYAVLAPIISAVAVIGMNYHWLTDVLGGAGMAVVLLWLLRAASATSAGQHLEARLTFSENQPPPGDRAANER
ncbi:hypothetical protein GCM10027298_12030 [Epidermidibacterium keratini]